MKDTVIQIAVIFLFFGLPGLVGGWLAYTKGRNLFGWFLLSFFFPPTLMVILFHKPLREVSGHYRQCPTCREFLKWRDPLCKYCKTDLQSMGEQGIQQQQ